MGKKTDIGWCHHTFNPWEGCQRWSPGCEHCYAERRNIRYHGGEHWGPPSTTKRLARSEHYWGELQRWNRAAELAGERRRVFVASLADVMEDNPDPVVVEGRARLWREIAACPWLDFLLLTKRPENFIKFLPWAPITGPSITEPFWLPPWENVWLGVTAENQQYADKRIPILLRTPAAVRFVSYEPALGPLNIAAYVRGEPDEDPRVVGYPSCPPPVGVDWLIAGSESGAGARTAEMAWHDAARAQCVAAGVPFFAKQHATPTGKKLPLIFSDGASPKEFPR